MVELSIIFPAYNEEERITPTLFSFHKYLTQKGITFEILVTDDGSTDNTVKLVQSLKTEIPNLEILALPENKGKGAAVRAGMLHAKGKIRLFSDADGSTPIEEIDKLLVPLQAGTADIAIGSRYLAGAEIDKAQPKFRVAWSRFANNIVQKVLLPGIVDPHCGFKAFSAEATENIFPHCKVNEWSFDLEVLALARNLNLRIAEIPVKWANDERSKGRISQLPKEIINLYRIKKRQRHSSKLNRKKKLSTVKGNL